MTTTRHERDVEVTDHRGACLGTARPSDEVMRAMAWPVRVVDPVRRDPSLFYRGLFHRG